MLIAEGIYRVDGLKGVNAYVVVGPDGVTLVDTGFPGNAAQILAEVSAAGHEAADIRTIVLTHGDYDHVGNVAALKAASGATVAIGADDAPALNGAPYERARGLGGMLFRLASGLVRTTPVTPDVLLMDGDEIAGFRVHALPGHTAGSIVLERGDGVVFSGDTLLGNEDGSATKPPRKPIAHDYEQALRSAAAIEGLQYTLLLPGHGEPVRAAPRAPEPEGGTAPTGTA